MIDEQAERVTGDFEPRERARQQRKELMIIGRVEEDRLLVVPSRHHVNRDTWRMDSECSCHGVLFSKRAADFFTRIV
jgi:hypothetical protein